MLRALPLHFIQETYATQRALCDLVKGFFTTSLCVLVTPSFQTSVSKGIFQLARCAWTLVAAGAAART